MASSSTETGASKNAVDHSAKAPRPVGKEPSPPTADSRQDSVDVSGIGGHCAASPFDDDSLARFELDVVYEFVGCVRGVAPGGVDAAFVQVFYDVADGA